jgi:hypothetical protein
MTNKFHEIKKNQSIVEKIVKKLFSYLKFLDLLELLFFSIHLVWSVVHVKPFIFWFWIFLLLNKRFSSFVICVGR